MEMGQTSLLMEISMWGSTDMGIPMGMGSISGKMETVMVALLKKGRSVERGNGKRILKNLENHLITMMESMTMI
jgi:hypothetical protein